MAKIKRHECKSLKEFNKSFASILNILEIIIFMTLIGILGFGLILLE